VGGAGYYNSMADQTDGVTSSETTTTEPQRIARLARRAAAGSYGVVGVKGPRWYSSLLARFGGGTPGVEVETEPSLRIRLYLAIAPGLPVTQVVQNVEKAVRYVIQRDVGRTIDELAIHVGGVLVPPSDAGAQGSLGRS
jgi:uncharacterized alkaline shock family protein YloU